MCALVLHMEIFVLFCACVFFALIRKKGMQLHMVFLVVFSVTHQQAAVVTQLGACLNCCIIYPPTPILTSG